MLIRNGSIVLFTDIEPDARRPRSLRYFHTDSAGDGVKVNADVELRYETVPAGAPDPFAACAFPASVVPKPPWGMLLPAALHALPWRSR